MTTSPAALRAIADAVERGDAVSRETVNEAIGELRRLQAEASRSALRRRRDGALQKLADVLAPGGRVSVRVDLLRQAVRKYEVRWRRVDRYCGAMPIAYIGKPEAHLWAAFSAGSQIDSSNPVPLGKTYLRGTLVSRCSNSETESAA